MLHKIFIIGLVLSFSSCMKIQKKESEQTEKATQAQMKTNEVDSLDYKYDLSGSVQRVVFHFSKNWGSEIVVEKLTTSKSLFQREVILQNETWSDQLSEDSKVKYRFYSKNNEKLNEEAVVLPALNLVVNEKLNLIEKYQIDSQVKKIYFQNLEIKSDAQLFIENFKGEIVVENLQSENGVLQTFAQNQRASSEKNGRSVGGFKLIVLSGSGHLEINLIAESGGDGQNGRGPDESLTGQPGAEGAPAQFSLVSTSGYCTPNPRQPCFPRTLYDCTVPPKNGGEGQQGLRGYPGTDGKNGGSVHPVEIANQSTQLQIVTIKVAGQKGKGGSGGSGGRGGPGGAGADGGIRDYIRSKGVNPDDPAAVARLSIYLGKSCQPALQGPTGIRGENGPSGHDGIDGQIF